MRPPRTSTKSQASLDGAKHVSNLATPESHVESAATRRHREVLCSGARAPDSQRTQREERSSHLATRRVPLAASCDRQLASQPGAPFHAKRSESICGVTGCER